MEDYADLVPLFANLASPMIGSFRIETSYWRRRYRAHFGTSLSVTAALWNQLMQHGERTRRFSPAKLLWALYFLKTYTSEDVASSFFHCSPKTYRKWTWIVIQSISQLELVS